MSVFYEVFHFQSNWSESGILVARPPECHFPTQWTKQCQFFTKFFLFSPTGQKVAFWWPGPQNAIFGLNVGLGLGSDSGAKI